MKKLASTFPNMVLSLVLICLTMGAILGLMNMVTKKPIKEAETQTKTAALSKVLPAFDNNPLDEMQSIGLPGDGADSVKVYKATAAGKTIGYAFETFSKNGFSGKISLMIGLLPDGTVHDFAVLSHSETPGLGAKMDEWFHMPTSNPGNIRDVRGISLPSESPMKVSKDGGKVDAITASTITSRAFVDAIERAYRAFQVVTSGATPDAGTSATKKSSSNEDAPAQDSTSSEKKATAPESVDATPKEK